MRHRPTHPEGGAERLPASTVGHALPASAVGHALPAPTVGHVRPAPTAGHVRPAPQPEKHPARHKESTP